MQETTPKSQLRDPNLVAMRHQASLEGHAEALRSLYAETMAAVAATADVRIADALRDEANKLMASHTMLLRQAQLVAIAIDRPLSEGDRSHPPPTKDCLAPDPSLTATASCYEDILSGSHCLLLGHPLRNDTPGAFPTPRPRLETPPKKLRRRLFVPKSLSCSRCENLPHTPNASNKKRPPLPKAIAIHQRK